MDRWREIIGEFQFPEFLVQLRPGVDATRHADRQHAGRRDRLALQLRELGFHLLVAQAEGRTAAAVDSVKFVFLRAVNDGKEVAADAVRDRFGQTERSVRRNRSVNRAATAFQNVDADLRGQRHARANHAMPRHHFRARGKILSGDPIDLSVELKGERKEKRSGGRNKTNKHGHGRRLRRLLSEENHALIKAPSSAQIAGTARWWPGLDSNQQSLAKRLSSNAHAPPNFA